MHRPEGKERREYLALVPPFPNIYVYYSFFIWTTYIYIYIYIYLIQKKNLVQRAQVEMYPIIWKEKDFEKKHFFFFFVNEVVTPTCLLYSERTMRMLYRREKKKVRNPRQIKEVRIMNILEDRGRAGLTCKFFTYNDGIYRS